MSGTVKNSILFPGVRVDQGAEVEGSILFSNTVIKQNARVTRTIIDKNATIGVDAQVGGPVSGDLSVIGTNTRIPKNTVISAGVTVYPNLGAGQFSKHFYGVDEVIE